MTDLLPNVLLITGTFILAGLVKGTTGLGPTDRRHGPPRPRDAPRPGGGPAARAFARDECLAASRRTSLRRPAAPPLGHDARCRRRHLRRVGADRRHDRARGDGGPRRRSGALRRRRTTQAPPARAGGGGVLGRPSGGCVNAVGNSIYR